MVEANPVASNSAPQVMVLGTYHFANPGLDLVKVRQKDTLGEDRQKEIAEVLDRLAEFAPTLVLVEETPERQGELDEAYGAYLEGRFELTANEVHQLGFRLAHRLGHGRLAAVDFRSAMDFDRLFAYAQKSGRSEFAERLRARAAHVGEVMSRWDALYTVGQMLALHNDARTVSASQDLYVSLLELGDSLDHPGADVVAWWYRRNLVIFQNIRRCLTPGARAVVLYGSGHAYYLNQLVRDDPHLEWVDPCAFLPAAPESAEQPFLPEPL